MAARFRIVVELIRATFSNIWRNVNISPIGVLNWLFILRRKVAGECSSSISNFTLING